MKNKTFLYLIAILSIVGLILSWHILSETRANIQFQNAGQSLIDKINCYQQTYGVLPEDMLEFEDEFGIGPFYEKRNDSTYFIFFCLGFDDYYMYNSATKEWYYFP